MPGVLTSRISTANAGIADSATEGLLPCRISRPGPETIHSVKASTAVPGPPTVLGMAASFTASMARFAASGFQHVDEQSHQLRVDACGECQYRQGNRCTLCGCFSPEAWLPH